MGPRERLAPATYHRFDCPVDGQIVWSHITLMGVMILVSTELIFALII
jgi:phosphatidylserine decarboxylase